MRDTCHCGHTAPSHYQESGRGPFGGCLVINCSCITYRHELEPVVPVEREVWPVGTVVRVKDTNHEKFGWHGTTVGGYTPKPPAEPEHEVNLFGEGHNRWFEQRDLERCS